jgi:hypothetical protein
MGLPGGGAELGGLVLAKAGSCTRALDALVSVGAGFVHAPWVGPDTEILAPYTFGDPVGARRAAYLHDTRSRQLT